MIIKNELRGSIITITVETDHNETPPLVMGLMIGAIYNTLREFQYKITMLQPKGLDNERE